MTIREVKFSFAADGTFESVKVRGERATKYEDETPGPVITKEITTSATEFKTTYQTLIGSTLPLATLQKILQAAVQAALDHANDP